MLRFCGSRLLTALVLVLVPTLMSAAAAAAAVPAVPIPEGPEAGSVPAFIGGPQKPKAVQAPAVPRHPFMAANGRSNIHDDAYQTDTYTGPGPLGHAMQRASTFQGSECASVTFDRAGRIVAVCVGLDHPRVVLMDPQSLALLATFDLPPRLVNPATAGNPFTDFSGGGYFYLDQLDRAVVPTTTRHIWVVGETSSPLGPGFGLERDYDVTAAVPLGDSIVSALPDWSGRIWFVSAAGVVGTVDPASGAVRSLALGEKIGNSFAVDETGGVFIVSDGALYRFDATPAGAPSITWRAPYANTGTKKPGQTQAGSGTTPTLMGSQYVAITDNADPMNIVVLRRAKTVTGTRQVCTHPVFGPGAGSTDQSLIGTGRSMVVENNYGYSGLTATERGATTTPRPGASRHQRHRHRLPHRLAQRRARALGRPEAVALQRPGLHIYEATECRRNRRLVLHRDRLPHGQHRLQPAGRHGARLQQQLRAGQHRPRRVGLRRRARWLGPHLGRLTPARRSSSTSTSGLGRARRRAHVARAYS